MKTVGKLITVDGTKYLRVPTPNNIPNCYEEGTYECVFLKDLSCTLRREDKKLKCIKRKSSSEIKYFYFSMAVPKIHIILLWFWEGDSYLVNKYLDCYSKKDDAIEFAKSAKKKYKASKVYMPGEEIPKEEDGEYGSKPFIQVVEIPLK